MVREQRNPSVPAVRRIETSPEQSDAVWCCHPISLGQAQAKGELV